MKKKVLIIGGGISGATIAKLLKEEGHYVEVHEELPIVGGMLRDEWDEESKIYISSFGAHITHFKEGNKRAYNFLKEHTLLSPFHHKVLCIGNSSFTYWPINEAYKELFDFISPEKDIEKEFVVSYSKKHWGENYEEVMKSMKNLPRFKFKQTRNPDFFENQKQFQPKKGYTNMILDLLKDCKIIYNRSESYKTINFSEWDFVILTSSIDSFFDFEFGELEFRGLDFIFKKIKTDGSKLLPTPVVNMNTHPKIIRIAEINQLQSNENNSETRILCVDTPNSKKNRFYPVDTEKNRTLLEKYIHKAKENSKLVLHGRTAEYKYKDIDDCIEDSIKLFENLKKEGKI